MRMHLSIVLSSSQRTNPKCDLWLLCASVLERLQTFLPQMAEANEKLRQQMEEAPAGLFDIEQVDQGQRVIEMVSVFSSCLSLHVE